MKVGDMVTLIEVNWDEDKHSTCCNNNGYFIGRKYKVTELYRDSIRLQGKRMSQRCTFPLRCIKQSPNTLKELLE